MSGTIGKLFRSTPLPEWLLPHNEIGPGAKVIYARLLADADENDCVQVSHQTLGEQIGTSAGAVRKYLRQLLDLKLLASTARYTVRNDQVRDQDANEYRFVRHPWMGMEGLGVLDDGQGGPVVGGGGYVPGDRGVSPSSRQDLLNNKNQSDLSTKSDLSCPTVSVTPTSPKHQPRHRHLHAINRPDFVHDRDFLEFKQFYPGRGGTISWTATYREWQLKLKTATADQILAGVQRYRRLCERENRVDTEWVMQPGKFIKDDYWAGEHNPKPPTTNHRGQPVREVKSLPSYEEVMRRKP